MTRSPSAAPEFWVRRLAGGADELRERVTARLVEQGILRGCVTNPLSLWERVRVRASSCFLRNGECYSG